jgi:hypothetical protein
LYNQYVQFTFLSEENVKREKVKAKIFSFIELTIVEHTSIAGKRNNNKVKKKESVKRQTL